LDILAGSVDARSSNARGEVMNSPLLTAFAVCIVILAVVAGCGHDVNNATQEDAARSFFDAMSKADSRKIEALNRSRLTTNDLLKEANDSGFVGAKILDYELTNEASCFWFKKRTRGPVLEVTIGLVDGKYYANDARCFKSDLSAGTEKAPMDSKKPSVDTKKMKEDISRANEKIRKLFDEQKSKAGEGE
jgi:hypothetical protein